MDRTRYIIAMLLAVCILAMVGCGDEPEKPTAAPEAPAAPDRQEAPSPGLILHQVFDADAGEMAPRLGVRDLDGQEVGQIPLPSPPRAGRLIPTQVSQRALLHTASDGWVLVDTAQGQVERLDIPLEIADNLTPYGFLSGDAERFLVLRDPRGNPAHLVEVETGSVFHLADMDEEIRFTWSGLLSPGETYLAVTADSGLWLLPTDDPGRARRLGDGTWMGNASFSSDGRRVAYVQRTDAGRFEAVVEKMDGSDSMVVAIDDQWLGYAAFVPGEQQLVLAREETLFLLSLPGGQEQVLLEFPSRSTILFAPSGRKLLVGAADERGWYLVDVRRGSEDRLDGLDGYTPMFISPEHRWLYFRDTPDIAAGVGLATLDLETGALERVRGLDEETRFFPVSDLAPDGEQALLRGLTEDSQTQYWLLDAKKGVARLLAEGMLSGGALSPDGQWLVYSDMHEEGESRRFELTLIQIDGEETRSLGEGVGPIWIRP